MGNGYSILCDRLKEIAKHKEPEELKRINDHFKSRNKVFQSIKEFEDYKQDLMNNFNLEHPKSEEEQEKIKAKAKENIINEYEGVIDGITIGIITIRDKEYKLPIIDENYNMKIPKPDIAYRTWLTLIDKEYIHDNILLNVSPNEDEARKYFKYLLDIVENNNIDTISKEILAIIENMEK